MGEILFWGEVPFWGEEVGSRRGMVPAEQLAYKPFRLHFCSNAQLPQHFPDDNDNNYYALPFSSTCLLIARNWNWQVCLAGSHWGRRLSSTLWDLAQNYPFENNWGFKGSIHTSKKNSNSLLWARRKQLFLFFVLSSNTFYAQPSPLDETLHTSTNESLS